MTKMPGPTERRVRAALLGMWERVGEGQFSWPSTEVRDEVNGDGEVFCSIDAVQRIGLRVQRGQAFDCADGWSFLEALPGGAVIEFTYSRGTFAVRRRPSSCEPDSPASDGDMVACPPCDGNGSGNGYGPGGAGGQCAECLGGGEVSRAKARRLLAEQVEPEVSVGDRFEDAREIGEVMEVSGARALVRWEQRGSTETRWSSVEQLVHHHLHVPATKDAEPRVTQRHLDRMREATGRSLKAARNHYCTRFVDADALADWTELVAMSLAGEGVTSDASEGPSDEYEGPVFHVTAAGFRLVYGDVRKPARKRAKR